MTIIIAFFIAGICLAGLVTIWFWTVYKELSAKRESLIDLEGQLSLHKLLLTQARDGSDARATANMLETSRMLCREAAKIYNRILYKPMNRIPGLLMGFRAKDEENE